MYIYAFFSLNYEVDLSHLPGYCLYSLAKINLNTVITSKMLYMESSAAMLSSSFRAKSCVSVLTSAFVLLKRHWWMDEKES